MSEFTLITHTSIQIKVARPSPKCLASKTKAAPPESLDIAPISTTSVNVTFPMSMDKYGEEISKYKIEYWKNHISESL